MTDWQGKTVTEKLPAYRRCPCCGLLRGYHCATCRTESGVCSFKGQDWTPERGWVCKCGADFCEQDKHYCAA
jgi:hypothetical protein